MKRNIIKGFLKLCAAAVLAAGLAGCSNLLETSEKESGSTNGSAEGKAVASVFIPDYDALAGQVSGARAVAPQTASVKLSSTAETAAFSAVSQALSEGTKTEGTNNAGVAGYSYTFTFKIPVGEYEAGSLKVETLDSDGSTLTSGVNASAVTVKAGEDATAAFTLVPASKSVSYSGELAAGEMQFIAVTIPAGETYEVTATDGVTLFLFDESGKCSSTLTGTEIANETEENATYYIGVYNGTDDEITSCSVTASKVVTTVDVTWDWVSQGVTQSSDGTTYSTDAITSGYLKGDSDTIVAEVTGGQFKIVTGTNPYGQMNSGATIKVPVSKDSVVTVTAWDTSAAANLLLGGKALTAISGDTTSNTASYTAEKAGYITLKAAADSTYIRSLKVTGLDVDDDFTADVVSFAAETKTVSNDSDTLGLTAATVSSSDEEVATAEIDSESSTIKITSVAAGSATITAKDSDSNEATIAVSVGDYGAVTIGAITKYSSETLYPDLNTTYVYIFDTAHYTAQDGETDAAGTITTGTSSSYTSDYLTVSSYTSNHGISGAATATLNLPAGKTTLTFVSCIYEKTAGTVTVTDSSKTTLASVTKTANTDSSSDKGTTGASCSFTLTEAQTVTITISGGYTHAIKSKTVTPVAATAVEISGDTSVAAGSTATLTATLTPSDSTDIVTWSSSNTDVATVDSTGVVTGVAEGEATITAKANDSVSGEYKITVTAATTPDTWSWKASDVTTTTLGVETLTDKGAADNLTLLASCLSTTGSGNVYRVSSNAVASIELAKSKGGAAVITIASAADLKLAIGSNSSSATTSAIGLYSDSEYSTLVAPTSTTGTLDSSSLVSVSGGTGSATVTYRSIEAGTYYLVTGDSSRAVRLSQVDVTTPATVSSTTYTYSAPTVTLSASTASLNTDVSATATIPNAGITITWSDSSEDVSEEEVSATITWSATDSEGNAASIIASDGKITTTTAGTFSIYASYTIDGTEYKSDAAELTLKDVTYYTVTFESNGGTSVDSQSIESGATATEPETNPTKAGYTFAGWYTSEDSGTTLSNTAYDFSTAVTADITLYAKWTLVYVTAGTYNLTTKAVTIDETSVAAMFSSQSDGASQTKSGITVTCKIDSSGANIKSSGGNVTFAISQAMNLTFIDSNEKGVVISTSDGYVGKSGTQTSDTLGSAGSATSVTLGAGSYKIVGATTSSSKITYLIFAEATE